MYIEDILAERISAAAGAGKIPELDAADVYTDLTGSNEWEGRSKVYVIRENLEIISDLSQEYGYSGIARARLTLAALGRDKPTANAVIKGALTAVRRALNDEPGTLDVYAADDDEITIDADDELYAGPVLEGDPSETVIDAADTVTIDAGDFAVFGAIDAAGRVTGDGWITADDPAGNIDEYLIWNPVYNDVIDWRLNSIAGTERFETGAWREQYFQIRELDLICRVSVE